MLGPAPARVLFVCKSNVDDRYP